MVRRSPLSTILAGLALAIALAGLLGRGAQPVAADTLIGSIAAQAATGTGFTYQGYLARNGAPINGVDQCDLRFSLWDAASAGAQVGNPQTVSAVDFANGVFTVTLNGSGQFGADAFRGAARWLQVELACPSGSVSFSTVGRQAITSVPYASYSQSTGALQGQPVSTATPAIGQVLQWDGGSWSPTNHSYTHTVLVSPADTPVASGARLLAAVVATSDSAPETPYLIKIEPGVYDLGTSTLQMHQYVDIEGSGQNVTRLVGQRQTDDITGLINAASNAELRQLSVEVISGAGAFAVGISNNNASPRISDVTIRTDGATSYGIVNRNGASPRIERVTALATGALLVAAGVATFNSGTPTLLDVSLQSQAGVNGSAYGIYATGQQDNTQAPTVSIYGGVIEAQGVPQFLASDGVHASHNATIRLYNTRIVSGNIALFLDTPATVSAAHIQIDAPLRAFQYLPSTLVCIGAYDRNFAALSGGC